VRSDAKASSAGSTSSKGQSRLLISLCLALAGLLALCASPALAAQTHPYTGTSFGPDGVGGSESFEYVQSLAVDPANGDTYVYDGGAGKVYKFDSSGAPVNFSATGTNAISGVGGSGGTSAFFQIALAPVGSPGGTAGDIYVANGTAVIHIYSAAGVEIGELEQGPEVFTCGAATDPSGNFYAGVYPNSINKFTPVTNPPTGPPTATGSSSGNFICNVAADGLGHFYAANYEGRGVSKLEGIGDTDPTLIDPNAKTMAVAPGGGDLYADRGDEVVQYSASGNLLGHFGDGQISESNGVAVNFGASKIYVGTPAKVKVFGPAAIVPDVAVSAVSELTDNSARLNGTINALAGPNATCQFEYVSKSIFAETGFATAASAPCEPAGPFSGSSAQAVSAPASGLGLATEYRFRLIGTNSNGSSLREGAFTTLPGPYPPTNPLGPCPAGEAFRSGFGANLPDCRAYERATPADKGGLDIEGFAGLLGAASDGSGVSFSSTGGSGTPAGGGGREDVTTLFSSRVGDSWATQRLLPPESLGEKAEYLGSSEDMRFSLVEAGDQHKSGLFLIDTSDESITQIVPYQTEQAVPDAFHYDAISRDGARLFFESRANLAPAASPGRNNLYVWDRGSGEVSVAGVLPAGEGGVAPPAGSFGGAYQWTFEETYGGGSASGQYVDVIHAASPDGDQIYFTAAGTGQLYLRSGLAGSAPTTAGVSKPNPGVEDRYVEEELFGERFPAAFQEATPDGSRAFFTSHEKLTADASTGEFDEGTDLYRYDRAGDRLVDITADQDDPENPNGARVQGLLGVSADGSSGYFAAKGKLTAEASPGANNIYRFEEEGDGSFDLTYVGEGGSRNWSPYSYEGGLIGDYAGKNSRVSADGGTLVYTTSGQIFVYRTADEKATCISCNPTGSPSIGTAELTASFFNSNNFIIPGAGPAARLTRSLSADGSRVFFQTPNALLAADTNGSPKCEYLITRPVRGLFLPKCMDVYEWEAVDAPGGSCTEAEVNGGCLYLLSTGKSEDASYFIDASSDGTSAFIATTSQLVPGDRDQLYDIYDVRIGGGLASQQSVSVAPCAGEACRTGVPATPSSQSAGSASFRGPGNVKSSTKKRCGKKHKCAKKKHKRNKNKHGHARSSKGDRK